MAAYTLTIRTGLDPDAAEQRLREELSVQGFGVLTEIDVQATLRAKLDIDMPHYRILGACNPSLAHQALQADADIGALLPCNVVVRTASDGQTEIVAADPEVMLGVADNTEQVLAVALEAKRRLEAALAAVAAA